MFDGLRLVRLKSATVLLDTTEKGVQIIAIRLPIPPVGAHVGIRRIVF
jgi:hypothetical protein